MATHVRDSDAAPETRPLDMEHASKASFDPAAPSQPPRAKPFLVELYRSALGKKYVMAITGVIGMGYVFAHMIGNLKMYLGAASFDEYAEFLRALLVPILPHHVTLWLMRIVLLVALALHVHAAYALTVMNRRARPAAYHQQRDWIAADFASRTMRWTGIITLLFIGYHLADLSWGWVNPGGREASAYLNTVQSLSQPAVAAFYIVANLALGFHLYHGSWSLFQSLGINNRRFNQWRRTFAVAFTLVVTVGNLSFPIAIVTGVVR